MPDTVVSVEHLSKAYRLGQIGTGTLTNDLKVWWAKARGKPNPLLKIGQRDPSIRPSSPGPSSTKNDKRETTNDDVVWALKDVSFEVKQGEVLGIIGRNGAGKSTLLKIITGVTAPTSGQIKAKGRVASLLEVGTGFHPELTGRENIYLNGAILGMKREEISRKFDEIVSFSEVEQFIDTPVKRYSSGMYVRLAFAVAAHLEPEILLVDEVLAVGDAEFQKKCLGKMEDVARGGRTVLFISHYIPSIVKLCSRSLLLSAGELELDGASQEVARVYLHEQARTAVYQKATSADGKDSIELVNSRGVFQVPLLGNLRIVADVASRELLSDKVVGFQVCSVQGEVLTTFATRDTGVRLPSSSSARVSVDFSVPFAPRRYLVNAFMFRDNQGYVIPPTTLAEIEVLDVCEQPGYFYPPSRVGSVAVAGSWMLADRGQEASSVEPGP